MVSQRTDLKLTRCGRCLASYFGQEGYGSNIEVCYITKDGHDRLANNSEKKRVTVHLGWDDFGENNRIYRGGASGVLCGNRSNNFVPIWFVFPCKCPVEVVEAWMDCDFLVLIEGENEGMHYTYSIEEPNKLEQTYDPATEQFTVKCPEMRHRGE